MNNDLIRTIRKIAKALWIKTALERTLAIGFYAVILIGIAIILTKIGLLMLPVWDYFLILLIGFVLGLSIGLTKKPSLYQTAMFLDDALLLKNRLTASLECLVHKEPNTIERLLLKEIENIKPLIKPAIVYNRLNMNYVFQFTLSILGAIIIWLLPINISQAQESFNSVLNNQSFKMMTTAQTLQSKESLDAVTKSLVNQMEIIAEAIKQNKSNPEEILKRLEALNQKTGQEISKIETGENLLYQISLVMNKTPESISLTKPEEINTLIKELEQALRNGQINIDMVTQLKDAIKQALNTTSVDSPLNQALQDSLNSLENQNIPLSEPLQKVFQEITAKNKQLMENIQTRLKITEREIREGMAKYQPSPGTPVASVIPAPSSVYSLANNNEYQIPSHPAAGQPDTFREIPIIADTPKERIALVQEVLKARATALQNPTWPSKYDALIKEYFK